MAEREASLDGENNEEMENSTDIERSASALAGLNLALILSSLTLSDEELTSFEEVEKKEKERKVLDRKANSCAVSVAGVVPSRRREVNEFRAGERQMAKVNTKIRDCRHGRKM